MRLLSAAVFVLALAVLCGAKPSPPVGQPLNNDIVIGIIDQPIIDESGCNLTALGTKYLPASYVKLVESVGARVVPIPFDAPQDHIRDLFNSVNGIIFPGGDADFTPGTLFYNNAKFIYDLVIQANDAGDYFPLIGICQGMEMLTVMMAESNCKILDFDYSAQNLSLPLDFTEDAKQSLLFGNMPQYVYHSLATQNVTFNAHDNGLSPTKFANSTSLQNMVRVLSTNLDNNGKKFVSSYEGIKYPIWGLQFHPSRLAYEWKPYEDMNHSVQAVVDMQFVAYSLYNQARFNHHQFDPQTLSQSVIYNSPVYYTAPQCSMFEQCYIWNNYSS